MPKICMVSVQHSPLDDRIIYKEAMSLQKAGFDVVQVCAADPDGFVYDIGGKTILNPNREQEMVFEGIATKMVKLPNGFLEKAFNKLFLGRFVREFIEALRSFKADVLHAHEPISYYLAHCATVGTQTQVIFDSHECWEDGTYKEMWIKKNYLSKLKYLISANQITRGSLVTLNKSMRSQVILNCAETHLFNSAAASTQPVIVHDGYLPFNRGLKLMVDVVERVKKQIPDVQLKLVGETFGDEKRFLQTVIQEKKLEQNIVETGWQPYQEVPKHLTETAVGIITKLPTTNNVIGGPPIKYYNYTAAGLAVVDVDMPETTRLLNHYKNGISVRSRSAEDIADALIYLFKNKTILQQYQQNSVKAAQELSWENESRKLIDFYNNEVLNTTPLIRRI